MLLPCHVTPLGEAARYPANRLWALAAWLRDEGVQVDAALALWGHDLQGLAVDDGLLSLDQLGRLVAQLQQAAARPTLALDAGWQLPLPAWGALGTALATAPDLRAALALLARFSPEHAPWLELQVEDAPDGQRWTLLPAAGLGPLRAFLLDHETACLARLVQTVAGRWPHDAVLEVPWRAPGWRAAYARLAGQVRFGGDRMSWWLPGALLARPNPGGSAVAFEAAWQACLQASAERQLRRRLASRVRRRLDSGGAGLHQITGMAAQFGVAARTLERHLAAEGTGFQALVDDWRCARSKQLLQQGGLSVHQVALQLGYRSSSNFSRSFRRWHGCAPRQLQDGKA